METQFNTLKHTKLHNFPSTIGTRVTLNNPSPDYLCVEVNQGNIYGNL